MGYALGVDVGTSFTAAAIWRSDDQQHKAEVVALGSRMPSVPSVLFLGADGSVVVGEAAERRALTDPDRVVREFKRRIGDDTPLFVGGQPYAAHGLAAMMVRWVVDRVTEREGGPPDQIAITHPAAWGPFKRDLLSRALGAVGLGEVTFLAEPEAAAISYAAQERVGAGATIAVYDLGGGTFDAAVVRKTGAGSFALLGSADGLEQLGGADFDEAVFTHVQAALGAQSDIAQYEALDVEDPSVLSGLARLRRECTDAKETLSSDTEVSIPVLLPGISAEVRLVRGEFEEMIRPALEDTVDSLSRTIRSAGLSSGDLGAVLLVGGSSRMPLVSQLVSAALGCPVVVDADPKATIALGAALSVAPQTQPAPMTTVAVAPPAADPGPPTSRERLPDQTPDHAPDRPPMIPAQREPLADRESTEDDVPLRRRIVTGRLRNIVGAGVLSGALLIALAVAAPGDGIRSITGGSSAAVPVSDPPRGAAAGGGSGGPAETHNAGSPNAAGSGNKATAVTQNTASVPAAVTSTAGRPALVRSDAQGGHVTAPVPPDQSGPRASDPPASKPPASDPPASKPPASDPPASDPPASDPPASKPPASDPPASDPPAPDPPASDPPAPDPPASGPPTSDPPTSDPPTSDPPASDPPASDPPASDPPPSDPSPSSAT